LETPDSSFFSLNSCWEIKETPLFMENIVLDDVCNIPKRKCIDWDKKERHMVSK
jgi:hypothetical protein